MRFVMAEDTASQREGNDKRATRAAARGGGGGGGGLRVIGGVRVEVERIRLGRGIGGSGVAISRRSLCRRSTGT